MPRNLIAVLVSICLSSQGLAQEKVKPVATFRGHVDAAQAVAFSPDGKFLASGSDDHSIILWDLAQGKPRAVLEGHHTSIWNLVFSPNGQLLASGIGQPSPNRKSGWDFTIKLWDVNTGKLRRSLEGCTSNVFSMAFSPDGKYLAACHNASSSGGNVKLWDVASGKMLGSPTRGGYGASLAFSNDGKLLAVADRDKTVELWDMSTGERKTLIKLTADVAGGVSFSPDDKVLAVGTTQSVTLCDLAAGKERRRLMEATFFPIQVLFSPDGKHLVAAASDWCSVTMWDVQTGKERVRFQPAPSKASSQGADGIAFSRDGALIASANRDSMVTVWRNPLSKLPLSDVKSGTRAVPKAAAPAPRSTSKERKADFQWFSALSYPDARDHQFVKVYTNRSMMGFGAKFTFGAEESKQSSETSSYQQQTVHGFLLEKKDNRFTVLTAGLAKETFEIDPKVKAKERVRFEPADLKAYAAGFLKELRAPRRDDGWSTDKKPSGLQVFILAWACWRRGFDELAADLHHAAAQMPAAGDRLSPRPLRELLAEELADIAVQSVLTSLGRQNASRATILRDLAEKSKGLPELANHDDIRILTPLLRKMVEEDAEHAKNAKPFAKLSQLEQIAELLFQLRDQGGYVAPGNSIWRQGAFEDPIDDRIDHDPWPEAPESPAQQLVKLGSAAAGQLIDHLDDERLTRSLTLEGASHKVLRIGDCAVHILERVSGRKFKGANNIPAETRRRILAWHAEVQKKGEKQTLIDGVSRGDEESYEQALRLMAKHGEEALAPIEVGIKAAKDDETRNWLLRAAGRLKGSDRVLLAELKDGFPSVRLEAARILHRRGRPEAVAGMIALWNTDLPHKQAAQDHRHAELLADVAHTLFATNQPAAINTVAHDLLKRPVGLRQAVVNSCFSVLAPWDGHFINPKRIESKLPAETRIALERILFVLLDDTEEDPKWHPSSRTCDSVAAAFNQISATLYPFNPKASIEDRNRAIRTIKSAWRQMHDGAEKGR